MTMIDPASIEGLLGEHCPESIFVTGGLGDCFVLDSFWSPAFRAGLRRIYWGARSQASIEPLLRLTMPHVAHVSLVPEQVWTLTRAFFSIEDICRRLPKMSSVTEEELRAQLTGVRDWSIILKYPLLTGKKYYGSGLVQGDLADASRFLPAIPFAVVQPYTSWNVASHRSVRDFTAHDWERTRRWLGERDLLGVVLNVGTDPIPDGFVDLTNRTTLAESIEVLKRAAGYIGIDSCLSVLAAQMLPRDRLDVRCRNTFARIWESLYYAPHRDFSFIHE